MAFRALMVAPAMPARRGNGLAMRLGIFLEALQKIAQTDLIFIPIAGAAAMPAPTGVRVLTAPLRPDTELSLLMRLKDPQQRLQSFVEYGKPILAGQFSSSAWAELARQSTDGPYDIVHISRAYMSPALRHFRGRSATTLDFDEDDRASFTSLAGLERKRGNVFQEAWYEQEGEACDHLVSEAAVALDLAFAANVGEVQSLCGRHAGLRIEYLPNAVDIPRSRRVSRGDTLLFVGTLGYLPNNEGLHWFLENVLPRIRARRACRIVIIGRGALPGLRVAAARAGVHLLDRVDDLEHYYRSARAVIAPMRSGGGTRIKLLEAASFGVPSIATPEAASGLYSEARPWGWIARGPQEFADACLEALSNAKEAAIRASIGRRAVSKNFDRAKIVRQLSRRFEKLAEEGEKSRDKDRQ